MDLSDEEKFFIAHFVSGSYTYVKPVCGKYISLFSFLDQTNESIETQQKQIDEDDGYFSDLLGRIYKNSNESTWESVFKELEREGYFSNQDFHNKFLAVATWLYSKDSLRYFFEARKIGREIYDDLSSIQKKLDMEAEMEEQQKKKEISALNLKSQNELEQDRANAMRLLNKRLNNSKTSNNSTQSTNWGLKLKSKLDGDGSDWREQS